MSSFHARSSSIYSSPASSRCPSPLPPPYRPSLSSDLVPALHASLAQGLQRSWSAPVAPGGGGGGRASRSASPAPTFAPDEDEDGCRATPPPYFYPTPLAPYDARTPAEKPPGASGGGAPARLVPPTADAGTPWLPPREWRTETAAKARQRALVEEKLEAFELERRRQKVLAQARRINEACVRLGL